jgi:hypothetical protein
MPLNVAELRRINPANPLHLPDGCQEFRVEIMPISIECNARHIEIEHSTAGYMGTSRGTPTSCEPSVYHHRLDSIVDASGVSTDNSSTDIYYKLRLLSLTDRETRKAVVTAVELRLPPSVSNEGNDAVTVSNQSLELRAPTTALVESVDEMNKLLSAEQILKHVQPEDYTIQILLKPIYQRLAAIETRLDSLERNQTPSME